MAVVSFEKVTKKFGEVIALDQLNLDVLDDEFLVLLGPSGCGKSTALRMVAGLDEPTSGVVRINGQVVNGVDPKDRDVAMVFQSYALYPHKSVGQNIEFPLRARKVPSAEREALVAEVAAQLDLLPLMNRKPRELSGGQRQRVALARALVRRPAVFLMDEPLSNLDAKLRTQTRGELVDLQQRLHTSFVYVTHDQVEAMTMATRVAVMLNGVLQQLGTAQDVYDRPANVFVAQFIGSPPMNIVDGTVLDEAGRRVVRVPGGTFAVSPALSALLDAQPFEAKVHVGIRPEHLRLSVQGAGDELGPALGVRARVRLVEALGHEHHLICSLEDGTSVVVRVPVGEPKASDGETVWLTGDTDELHLFDANTGRRVA